MIVSSTSVDPTGPSMLASAINDASAWRGADLSRGKTWIWQLSAEALCEIDAAVREIGSRGLPIASIGRSDFPLPTFASELDAIGNELHRGRGFVLLRGLALEKYTDEEAAVAFWGIGTYLGTAASQNAHGDLLGHVRDQGYSEYQTLANVRGYQTRAKLAFHTDSVDIVGLLCLRKAKAGGESSIVSSTTIHNEILAHHREYLGLLYREYLWDLRGEELPGEEPVYRGPIYSYFDGFLSCRPALLDYIFSAQKRTGIPLSSVEIEALRLLESLCAREDLRLDMEFEPGDMQFLHNSVILHSRTDYIDYDEPDRKRHLLRLWLNARDRRPLAPDAFVARRDGVRPRRPEMNNETAPDRI
ncbi:MAG: TauD/TfdA family dioxygenase [Candidatus Velthaea sp.]